MDPPRIWRHDPTRVSGTQRGVLMFPAMFMIWIDSQNTKRVGAPCDQILDPSLSPFTFSSNTNDRLSLTSTETKPLLPSSSVSTRQFPTCRWSFTQPPSLPRLRRVWRGSDFNLQWRQMSPRVRVANRVLACDWLVFGRMRDELVADWLRRVAGTGSVEPEVTRGEEREADLVLRAVASGNLQNKSLLCQT